MNLFFCLLISVIAINIASSASQNVDYSSEESTGNKVEGEEEKRLHSRFGGGNDGQSWHGHHRHGNGNHRHHSRGNGHGWHGHGGGRGKGGCNHHNIETTTQNIETTTQTYIPPIPTTKNIVLSTTPVIPDSTTR